MPANDAWEWRSANRAAFHDYHGPAIIGYCESCGEPIYEGETFEQSVGREADGSTTVLTCGACLERNEAEGREMRIIGAYDMPQHKFGFDCHICTGPHRRGYDLELNDPARVVCLCELCACREPFASLVAEFNYQQAQDEARRDFEAMALWEGI